MWTVRQKAKELVDFVQDDDRVREERRKAKKAKDKYIGLAGEAVSRQYNTLNLCALIITDRSLCVKIETNSSSCVASTTRGA